ncbi:rCG44662 [Rattus norvegicus]|uniref:RCG44662 n=1 Tax=Rattus norvegicus TaxID=10116 RepID=A6I5C9_RAT|nr:rCG44662 [Rattus norvegicus]
MYCQLTDMLSPCLKERDVSSSVRTWMYLEFQNTTSRFHEDGC